MPLPDLTQQYHTTNLVVRCSDFRLRNHIEDWIDKTLETADELVGLGAGLILLREGRAQAALEDIRALRQLHGFSDVWFIFHTGCGAYKHFRGGTTPELERAAQLEDVEAIEKIMADEGLKPHFLLMKPSGQFIPFEA